MKTILRYLRRLHQDDRGNLGILLILVLWVLVVLIGLVWNSGEYTTRRQHVQNAADAAAHAATMWTSRTTNLVSATNMAMCQNGCAEVIWNAVDPTNVDVQNHFDYEIRRTDQILVGNRPGEPEKNIPDTEHFDELLGLDSWAGDGEGQSLKDQLNNQLLPNITKALPLSLPYIQNQSASQLQAQIQTAIADNDSTLQSILSQWIPLVAAPVNVWIREIKWRLQEILNTMPQEQDQLNFFYAQALPALSGITPQDLLAKRQVMFDYEKDITDQTSTVIDDQRDKIAKFYQVKLTYATPRNDENAAQSAIVTAPIHEADVPVGEIHTDMIRPEYPAEAIARFGTDSGDVWIDPINVNVDNSSIWHPGVTLPVDPSVTLYGDTFTGSFRVHGGEWGQLFCAPLLRYFDNRLWRDEQGLRQYMLAIDQIRAALGTRISGLGAPPLMPNPPVPPQPIPQLPTSSYMPPADLAFVRQVNTDIRKFNQDVANYINNLADLWNDLDRLDYIVRRAPSGGVTSMTIDGNRTYQGYGWFQSVALAFADITWRNNVEYYRRQVLYQMGQDKQFMILKPYKLRPIPDWAKPGMQQSAYNYIKQWEISHNLAGVQLAIYNHMRNWAYQLYIANGVNKQQAQLQAHVFAVSNTPALAQELVNRGAEIIAPMVAEEWISRSWPYEITPPPGPADSQRGLQDDDRFDFFTALAAAQTTPDTDVKPILTRLFRDTNLPMTAYAQTETFNWMEFNSPYGSDDRYDHETDWGHYVHGGSPTAWRLSTIGGWNWNPRLAYSDALGPAIDTNPEFGQFFQDSGVPNNDLDAVKTITLH